MVGNLNNMSAIRQKRLSYCYNGAEVLSTKKHNASHLSVWNVQCAPGMFSYAGRCYSKQISARRCMTEKKKKTHLEPMMEMKEIGNRLRACLVRGRSIKDGRHTQMGISLSMWSRCAAAERHHRSVRRASFLHGAVLET